MFNKQLIYSQRATAMSFYICIPCCCHIPGLQSQFRKKQVAHLGACKIDRLIILPLIWFGRFEFFKMNIEIYATNHRWKRREMMKACNY